MNFLIFLSRYHIKVTIFFYRHAWWQMRPKSHRQTMAISADTRNLTDDLKSEEPKSWKLKAFFASILTRVTDCHYVLQRTWSLPALWPCYSVESILMDYSPQCENHDVSSCWMKYLSIIFFFRKISLFSVLSLSCTFLETYRN